MKKGTKPLLALAVLLLIIGFIIRVPVEPSGDLRVIIDHTLKVYSTPKCYNEAGLTNFLEETTLDHAQKLGYEGESSCTNDELTIEKKPFLIAIFQ